MSFLGVPIPSKLIELYFRISARPSLFSSAPLFHSLPTDHHHSNMKVRILPANSDNYMYLIVDEATKAAAVVDPVHPESVLSSVEREGANLTTVLTTHHHWDHAGGNEKLVDHLKATGHSSIAVVGADSRIGALTHKLGDGDEINVGNLKVRCLFTPCHTTGHLCYHVTGAEDDQGAIFTGDTLFISGCGKFFEEKGQPGKQMYHALMQVLYKLPDSTKVYCGHEYTLANLAFAQYVEPQSRFLNDHIKWAKSCRDANKPTTSTIGQEKLTNPFMRVDIPSVQEFTKTEGDPILTMAKLRAAKDRFKGREPLVSSP